MIPEEKMKELQQYKELLDSGVITKEEFEAKKEAIMKAAETAGASGPAEPSQYTPVSNETPRYYRAEDVEPKTADSGSFGWAVLGFFIPLVGLILFLVWRNNKPLSAKKAGMGALVGFILGVIGNVASALISAGGGY